MAKLTCTTETCPRCHSSYGVPTPESLLAARLKAGLTRPELAQRIGVDPSFLAHVEFGRRRATPKVVAVYEQL